MIGAAPGFEAEGERDSQEEPESKAEKAEGSGRSSMKGHRVNAVALIAEEGRGKLRKVMGSRKRAEIHEYPNGETRRGQCPVTTG